MGRCPPGVLCIENVTIVFFIIVMVIIFFIMYNNNNNNNKDRNLDNNYNSNREKIVIRENNLFPSFPSFPIPTFRQNDVLLNPYDPPLRDDSYYQNFDIRMPVPINIKTQGAYNTNYRQVGVLTRINGKETILPLMGRPLIANRDKWNFYTMTDKNNMIKLPITVNGKSGTSEYGCDNVYNGDTVFVQGYNDGFKVTTYDNDSMRYM